MNQNDKVLFESFYDKYSSLIFGILLEICPSRTHANTVLLITFEKVYSQNLYKKNSYCVFSKVAKLAIQIASERFNLKKSTILKPFENCPLLHTFVFENINIDDHCEKFKLNRLKIGKNLRSEISEFKLIRDIPFMVANDNLSQQNAN